MPESSGGVTAFIDGASRGNPGAAAAGVVISDERGERSRLSVRIGITTNNVAEYYALILALQEALILKAQEIQIFTDSELVAKQFSGEYKIKDASLKMLSLFVRQLKKGFKKVSVTHVPREENKLADSLANEALDQDLF